MSTAIERMEAAQRKARGEIADAQRTEAWRTFADVNCGTDPAIAAWAIGVQQAQHADMVLGVLHGGTAMWTESGGRSWSPTPRRPGCATRCCHDRKATRFLTWEPGERPLLVVPHTLVDSLIREADIPAELLAELEESSARVGTGNDAEMLANQQRAYEAGAAAWELARPAPTLLDMLAAS